MTMKATNLAAILSRALITPLALFAALKLSAAESSVVHTPDDYSNVRVLRNLEYGTRPNLENEGEGFGESNYYVKPTKDQWGNWNNTHETGQTYDLYYPSTVTADTPIFVFLHGGAYVSNIDKGIIMAQAYDAVQNKGVIIYSMNYIMPQDYISYPTTTVKPNNNGVTISDMVRDVDAMISHVKTDAAARGFNADRLVLWGESAGAHLAQLYAYDEKNPSQLGLGLKHELPVKVVLDMAGPVDLTEGGGWDSIGSQGAKLLQLFGIVTEENQAAKYTTSSMVTSGSTPTVLCYNNSDGLIPLAQYTTITQALETAGVPFLARLNTVLTHGEELTDATSRNWAIDAAIGLLNLELPAGKTWPAGYTYLPDGLKKSVGEKSIIVTDCFADKETWMKIDLEFGSNEGGKDSDDVLYSTCYFMGLCGLPNGHMMNGCIARYRTYDSQVSFWCDTDISEPGFSNNGVAITPCSGRQTLKFEYGKVSFSNETWKASSGADQASKLERTGKTEGPLSIFGCRYLLSSVPYQSREMTVYSWKIYESESGKDDGSGVLKRAFYPVTETASGERGLYDVMSGKFFPLSEVATVKMDCCGGYSGVIHTIAPFTEGKYAPVQFPKGVKLDDLPPALLPIKMSEDGKTALKLAGFFSEERGNGTQYFIGGKSLGYFDESLQRNPVLYANWVNYEYHIDYQLAGGKFAGYEPTTNAVYGSQFPVYAPERKGYRFIGWTVTGHETSCAQYSLSEGGELVNLNTTTGNITCDGVIWVKNLRGQNNEDTVTLTAQWEIALPPEYEKLDCLDNGSVISTAGFVQVTGFHFDVENAVAITYCMNADWADYQNLFFSRNYEDETTRTMRTEFGLCYANPNRNAAYLNFHHACSNNDKCSTIKNDGATSLNATNRLVLAETGSKFNEDDMIFSSSDMPASLTGKSLPNDLLIFTSDYKDYADGYPYNDLGALATPALAKIFSFKVMANNETDPEVILNLVPAKRKADDVEGFYDVVNGGFYPLRHRCALPTEIASHAVETWQEKAATESECGYKCGVCTDCLMRISQMILPTQPTRSWPYDGANHKPTISNTNDVMGKAGCTVTYSPAGEWKTVATDYTATYALTPGHVWSDGTTEAKTISYSIVPADGADFYVTADADGSGNGSSWASPFTFQEALNAVKGAAKDVTNTIYMKVGTYTNPSGPWTATINPCFIRILGGYTGVNLARSQTEYTVLDGENAHGLVSLTVNNATTGHGKSILFDQIEFRQGLGAYKITNNAGANYWSLFNRCRFIDNVVPVGDTTTKGSAIEVTMGMSWVSVEYCEFRGNKACTDYATTIYAAEQTSSCYCGLNLSHSVFVGNSSKVRPCVAQFGGSKDNNVTIESCTFAYNAVATDADRTGYGATVPSGGVVLSETDTNGFDWKVCNNIFFGNRAKGKGDNGDEGREYYVKNTQGSPKPKYILYENKDGYEWCFGGQGDPVTCHYMVGDPMFVTPLPAAVEFDANYNPTWYVDSSKTATVAPSAMDVHLQSKEGRWTGSAWVNDTVDSPALDAGDPKADYSLEPVSNGARINLGAYGNTAEASKSKVLVALDANGGPTDPDPAIVMVAQGEAMPTLTDGQKLSRPGYVFLGYGDKQWEARLMTGADTDICNEGTTVFAKMAAGGGTINGVSFGGGLNGSIEDQMELEGTWGNSAAYWDYDEKNDPNTSANYKEMLFSATWQDDNATEKITLKGLTAGRSYLFQFFIHDGRRNTGSGGNPGSRTVSVDGTNWYRFGQYGYNSEVDAPESKYGATFIYRFVASGDTEEVEVNFQQGVSLVVGAQFNAVQLRDITATDPHKYYNDDGTSAKVYPVEKGPSKLYAIWKYNIPDDFEILPCLNFDGTHFILTDYVPISNTWIETEMQAMGDRVSGSAALFGFFEKLRGEAVESVYGFNAELATSGSGSAVYGWVLGVNSNSGGRGRMWWGNNGWSYLANKCKVQFGYTGFTMSDGSTTISGEVRPDIKFDMDNCFPCHTALVIGGYNGALPSSWAGKTGYGTPVRPYSLTNGGLDVYSFKIYESDNGGPDGDNQQVKHDFVPVTRTGDGKEGFYDIVGQKFYPLKTETVVTLDRNGGNNLETNYVYAIAGEALPTVTEIPKKAGHAFAGYFTAASDGTKYYNADGTCVEGVTYPDEGGPATLYAQWEADKYHVINPVSGPEIVVNYEWLANAYGSGMSKAEYQQKLFTTNQYGVVNWQAYILGYEPDELEMAAILEESVQNTYPETVTIRLRDWEEREAKMRTDETGCTLKYTLLSARTPGELMTDGGTVVTNLDKTAEFLKWPDWSFEAPLRDLDDENPVNYYRIKIHFIFGGGDAVLYSHEGIATAGDDGWTMGGEGLTSPDVEIPDAVGKYLQLKFKGTASIPLGITAVVFYDESSAELREVKDILYVTNDGAHQYVRPFEIPDGAVKVQMTFKPRNNTDEAFSVSDVELALISEGVAVTEAEAFFDASTEEAFATAMENKFPESTDWDLGIPKLRDALKNGTPYRLLVVGCPLQYHLTTGLLEEQIRKAIPGAKLEIDWKSQANATAGTFVNGLNEINLDEYDGVMFHATTFFRCDSIDASGKTYDTDLKDLIDAIKAKKSGIEFFYVSPLFSTESRYGDDNVYWTDGNLYAHYGDECASQSGKLASDWWRTASNPASAQTAVASACATKNVACWELYDVAYEYLWLSGKPIGWFNRAETAYCTNERGRQLNVRILVEAFKRLAACTD